MLKSFFRLFLCSSSASDQQYLTAASTLFFLGVISAPLPAAEPGSLIDSDASPLLEISLSNSTPKVYTTYTTRLTSSPDEGIVSGKYEKLSGFGQSDQETAPLLTTAQLAVPYPPSTSTKQTLPPPPNNAPATTPFPPSSGAGRPLPVNGVAVPLTGSPYGVAPVPYPGGVPMMPFAYPVYPNYPVGAQVPSRAAGPPQLAPLPYPLFVYGVMPVPMGYPYPIMPGNAGYSGSAQTPGMAGVGALPYGAPNYVYVAPLPPLPVAVNTAGYPTGYPLGMYPSGGVPTPGMPYVYGTGLPPNAYPYGGVAYPAPGYPPTAYSVPQGYPAQGYSAQGYPAQGYLPTANSAPQGYSSQGYPSTAYSVPQLGTTPGVMPPTAQGYPSVMPGMTPMPIYPTPVAPQPVPQSQPAIAPVSSPPGQVATTSKLLKSTALNEPSLRFQAVYIYQGDQGSGRARVSGVYPLTPRFLVGGTLDFVDGNAFADTATQGISLNELYFSAAIPDLPNFRLVAGQLDLTSYFDRNSFAKDATTMFFSPVFQTNPALAATGIGSRQAALVNWSITDSAEVKAAVFSSSQDLSDFSLDGFAGELGIRSGNFIVRATYATNRDGGRKDGFQEIFQVDRGNGQTGLLRSDREESYGFGAEVYIPEIKMGIFGRYGQYYNRGVDRTANTYSLGVTFLDLFAKNDRLGLAYGQGLSNASLRRRLGNAVPDTFEAYYDFALLPNLRLGFSFQANDSFSESILGVRIKTDFNLTAPQ